jgi:TRAP-type uncharacterized transport system substrate-binding protein
MKLPHLLRLPRRSRPSWWRLAVLAAFGLLCAIALARVDLKPSYAYLDAGLLSGPPEGQYHAIADRLAARAAVERGRLANVATAGSVENLQRLARAAEGACDQRFALVQDGIEVPAGARLELIGRLPQGELVLLLGRGASRLEGLPDLAAHSVGVGPEGSGTAQLGRALLGGPDVAGLGLRLQHHPVAAGIEMAARGELDFAMVVTDRHAALVRHAIRDLGLELVSFPTLFGLATRVPSLSVEELAAGTYDPLRALPPAPTSVLRVDTLVLANRCARRADRVALLALLSAEFPDFVARNQGRALPAGLPLATASRQFFVSGEPEIADRYLPWLVNIMPPSNWVYVVMAVSLLFNAMSFVNRFRLWRVDVRRERLDERAAALFGAHLGYDEIRDLDPATALPTPAARQAAEELLDDLASLHAACHRHAASMVVPMGQEMSYRYQESLIEGAMAAIARVSQAHRPDPAPPP